jgi:cytochrome b561
MLVGMNTDLAYDRRTILLHWLSAALVLGLWTVGQCIDFFPKGDPRVIVRSLHITAGAMLACVLAWRIVWRAQGGRRLPPADAGAKGRLAIGVHHLLYLLLVAVVVAGLAAVWIRGDNLFNLFKVPAFPTTNEDLREEAVDLHGLIANVLLVVAGLHAAAAVWHHRVLHDGVLRRMWPTLR